MILMFIEHDESAGCCRLFFDVPPKGKDCHGVHLWPGELEMMAKVLGVKSLYWRDGPHKNWDRDRIAFEVVRPLKAWFQWS